MHRTFVTRAAAAALLLALAACGSDDNAGRDASANREIRTIEVEMIDTAFEPVTLDVQRGETIRFRFTNRGDVAHDAFVGDREAQVKHEAEMRDPDEEDAHGGDHGEDAEDAVAVEPGENGELTFTFDEAGTFEVGCHQPGHYDGGMKITVEVS